MPVTHARTDLFNSKINTTPKLNGIITFIIRLLAAWFVLPCRIDANASECMYISSKTYALCTPSTPLYCCSRTERVPHIRCGSQIGTHEELLQYNYLKFAYRFTYLCAVLHEYTTHTPRRQTYPLHAFVNYTKLISQLREEHLHNSKVFQK